LQVNGVHGRLREHRSPEVAVVVVYTVLALVGVCGTWWFNLRSGQDEGSYLDNWFATAASSSAAVDVIVVAVVACVFMAAELRRLALPSAAWVLLPLTFVVAVAFSLPAFLALRERALRDRVAP
jgi:membrane associated rhomboid family serine protease